MQTASTRLRAGLAATAATAALSLGFASIAGAATFKGTTSQEYPVKLTVNRDGVPAKFVYSWDMKCRGGGKLKGGSTLSARFGKAADVNGFRSKGSYTDEVERKFEAEIKVRVEGDRRSDTRFTGKFKLKAKVFNERTNELVARCGTGNVRWTADLKGPAPVEPMPQARFQAR